MKHHPEHALLEQYAAGTLPLPVSLCIAVHNSYCAQCRGEVQVLQNLGGALFEQIAPVAASDTLLQQIFHRIEQEPELSPLSEIVSADKIPNTSIPAPLRKLIPQGYDAVPWSPLLPGLRAAMLDLGDDDYRVSLHRIAPGGKVAMHDHRGEEITLVLNGSFSDEYGVYGDGDFIVRGPEQVHRPLAAQNEECICLAVQQAPVRFTGFFWRLLNPFLR